MDCFLDFETSSELDLRKVGPSRYSRHHSTQALMLIATLGKKRDRWRLNYRTNTDTMGIPDRLAEYIRSGCTFHAFNVTFEINIWRNVMVKRHGWPDIPNNQWFCTQAKSSYNNLPKNLDKLCVRCGLSSKYQKDKTGKLLIQKLSSPTKVTKAMLKAGFDGDTFEIDGKSGLYYFNRDPGLLYEFEEYCVQDVVAEIAADAVMLDMPSSEKSIFYMDMAINQRGFPIDRKLCEGAVKIHSEAVERTNAYLKELTGNPKMKVTTDTQLKNWIRLQGCDGHFVFKDKNEKESFSLKESVVTRFLDSDDAAYYPEVVAAITARADARSNTVTKYRTCLQFADDDDRVRHSERYYGAATGRWTGSGFHPHNFKRLKIPSEQWFDLIKTGSIDILDACLPAKDGKHVFRNPIDVLKACVRGIIKAGDGKHFIISDFAGIENRVNHWVCGNHRMLDLFAKKQDIYIEAVCQIWKVKHEEVAYWDSEENKWKILEEHYEKRQVGKQAELGLGYGMGPKTFQMHLHNDGIDADMDFTEMVVKTWRAANKAVCDMWYKLNSKCLEVVKAIHKKKYIEEIAGPCKIRGRKNYLEIVLPSGRSLLYFRPGIRTHALFDTDEITYIDGSKGAGYPIGTYGAKILENIVQGISRDLLCNSMRIIEESGREVILHVQDESVTETDIADKEAFSICHNAMETVPSWAEGLPLHAETHTSVRYTK